MRLQAAQLCPPWHAIGERLKQCPTETFEDEDREGDEAGEGGEAGGKGGAGQGTRQGEE